MTRETKIGLLVGLGFIVVFAVLLSHNGTAPSPVAQLATSNSPAQPVSGGAGAAALLDPLVDPGAVVPQSLETPASNAWLEEPHPGSVAQGTVNSTLPAPQIFNDPALTGGDHQPAPLNDPMQREIVSALPREGNPGLLEGRVAPEVVVQDPQPGVRPDPPVASANPMPPAPAVATGSQDEPQGTPAQAHAMRAEVKPYTVKKGDTLISITRDLYKNSSPKVIDFLVETNRIKDRRMIIEGQKLVIPPLPPDMFVTTTVSGTPGQDLNKVEEMLNRLAMPGGRRAPEPARAGASGGDRAASFASGAAPAGPRKGEQAARRPSAPSGRVELIPISPRGRAEASPQQPPPIEGAQGSRPERNDKAGKSEKPARPQSPRRDRAPGRWYQVQPKDTFSSIAERELGSSTRWMEIKQLNKEVDPARMKPGTRLRLPGSSRESLSGDGGSRRVTA